MRTKQKHKIKKLSTVDYKEYIDKMSNGQEVCEPNNDNKR